MIIQLTGNVEYSITLDPSVWIFDDRKVLLDDAFTIDHNEEDKNQLDNVADRWSKEVYQQRTRPPVNKSITRFEREKILKNSYVMPINEFLSHAKVKSHAKNVTLETSNGVFKVSLEDFQDCYLLFAVKGKPIKENGPVHIYFKDGSNKEDPIKGVQKIIIN